MTAHPSRRSCPLKVDVTEDLIASMEEAVKIMARELPPGRFHTVADLAAIAAARTAKQR